jgi:hypothetical protein
MKVRIMGLIALDIVAMLFISRTESFTLTIALVMSLFVANILLALMLRRWPPSRRESSSRIIALLHGARWTDYIPILGGGICGMIGVFEFAWKLCVIGAVGFVVGLWRIWSNGRVRQALRNRG